MPDHDRTDRPIDRPICTICMDAINDDRTSVALRPCGHVFHSECAVAWFRSTNSHGTCPDCRGAPDLNLVRDYTLAERVTLVRRAARRRSAPKRLKALVQRLRDAEDEKREASRALRAATREETVKSVQKRVRLLQKKKWQASRKVRKQRRLVGLFDDESLGIASPDVLIGERGRSMSRRV